MKNPKTCEEYVLSELEQAKADAADLFELCENMMQLVKIQDDLLETITKRLHIRPTAEGKRLITSDYIFEEFDAEVFEKIERYLSIKYPDGEEEA